MDTPAAIEERYLEAIADLKRLATYCHAVSSSLAGKNAPGEREYYASIIFAKMTMHAISISRNTPRGLAIENDLSGVVWDVSSICVLVRALIESFDALAYVAVHPISEELRSLRIQIWELHDKERRVRMLKLIGSRSPLVSQIEHDADQLRANILANPILDKVYPSYRGKISKKECPDFLQPLEERNQASAISHTYYLGARMFLSSYVHTHPFSVHQLASFKAGDTNSLVLISVAVRYAVTFLAKAIEGMTYVFGEKLPAADEPTNRAVLIWCGIAKSGVSDVV
jgi:hypothetical protein